MYNLNTHEAFNDLKDYQIIQKIILELFEKKNYNFLSFNDMIPDYSKELASALISHQVEYRNIQYNNIDELTAKIEGDIFEVFVMFFLQYFRGPDIYVKAESYTQVVDSEDVGMDFFGICEGNQDSRIFGQIKYRNRNITNAEPPFTRTVCNKLIGAAVIKNQFDFNHDKILFVTNLPASLALHFKLKNDIGWANELNPDVMHEYIKVVDQNTIQNAIGFNYKTFWQDFLKEFES